MRAGLVSFTAALPGALISTFANAVKTPASHRDDRARAE